MITETSMADTLQYLRSGKMTSKEVTLAICKRATIAHQLTNCLTEIFLMMDWRGRMSWTSIKEHGKQIGPVLPSVIVFTAVTWPSCVY